MLRRILPSNCCSSIRSRSAALVSSSAEARPSRCERRAQVVRDRGDKLGPQLVELTQPCGLGAAGLTKGALQHQPVHQYRCPDAHDHQYDQLRPQLAHLLRAAQPEWQRRRERAHQRGGDGGVDQAGA